MNPCQENDIIRLRHALDAARQAKQFAHGHTLDSLLENQGLQLILARLLEIVGEATGAVSPECRAQYPDVPWPRIKALRNWLAHVYFDINFETIWNITQFMLDPLIAQLESILCGDVGNPCASE